MLYEISEKAIQLENQGKRIIKFNLGDTDMPTPPEIVEAAYDAMKQGKTHYSSAAGEKKLREELVSARERLVASIHAKILLAEGQPECSAEELIAKIEEVAAHLPKSREELAARLHALARIDLRDVPPAPVPRDLRA